MMRLWTILLAVACAAGGALADDISMGGLAYNGVRVTDVKDCQVEFQIGPNRLLLKPLKDVDGVKLSNYPDFNRAEDLLRQGKFTEAAPIYDRTMRTASQGWLEKLARHRLLCALDRGAMIDRAVEEWLAIVEENRASDSSLALRPENLAKRGSTDNKRAIDLLEKRVGRITGSPKYVLAVKELLLKLYRVEERQEQVMALAEELTKSADQQQDGAGPSQIAPSGSLQARLEATAILLQGGKADEALKTLEANLRSYSHFDLARALLLIGKAQMELADKADAQEQQSLRIKAGLNFMRVAVFFPDSPDAAEGLYLAGRVNGLLGNEAAAAKAYLAVMERYGAGAFAAKAQGELEEMEKRQPQ